MPNLNTFKNVNQYGYGILASYQQKMKQQQVLLTIIKNLLATPLTEHVLNCAISKNKLLIYTDSGIWSSQLRFYQPNILNSLIIYPNLAHINRLQIKIIPPIQANKKLKLLKNKPSHQTVKLLQHCAQSTVDKKLKHALVNLSRTLTKVKV
jgi:hypothetical protein